MSGPLSVDDVRDLAEDEVFERLGTSLLGTRPGPADDPEGARRFGERWFGWKLKEVRTRLCGDEALRRLGPEPDAAAVADLLTKLGDASTVACVAVLVVRRGLEAVCEDDDHD